MSFSLYYSPSTNLDHLLSITERFLQSGRLTDLLWSYCLQTAHSDSPQFKETLLGRIVALPDLTANKLQLNNKTLFLPHQYYPLLAEGMLSALERTCQALKGVWTLVLVKITIPIITIINCTYVVCELYFFNRWN